MVLTFYYGAGSGDKRLELEMNVFFAGPFGLKIGIQNIRKLCIIAYILTLPTRGVASLDI